MKELKDFEDDIYKCSRCGLCQSVCPVYKASLNECAVSRGKFNILNGIIKQELSFSPQVKEYLVMCTGCNACKDFCPSKINAKEIFIAAKAEYHKTTKQNIAEKVLTSYTLFKVLLVCGNIFFKVYRFFQIEKITDSMEKYILKTGILGKRLILLNKLARKTPIKKIKIQNNPKSKAAIYFEGCFNQYLNSETKEAVEKILRNSDIKIIKKDFECCGVSYLNDGNTEQFKKLAEKNLRKLNCNYDYLITDCASCNEVLKRYKDFTPIQNGQEFSTKVISVTELISQFRFKTSTNLKIAVHKPCHDNYDFVEIVKNIENINFYDVEDYDKCCGFSGKFAIQNSQISREISKFKAQKYIDKNIDIILTTCPACLLGLNQGLAEIQSTNKPRVMNLFVFLAVYCTKT